MGREPDFSRYAAFEKALVDRLAADGFVPVAEHYPLAAAELALLAFPSYARVKARRTFVVGCTRGDALVTEQLRYLSDQFYNALAREANAIRQHPTLLRGICIFAFERTPDQQIVGFLMNRVRPRSPLAAIRSVPWIYDMERRALQRPALTRAPFDPKLLDDCVAAG